METYKKLNEWNCPVTLMSGWKGHVSKQWTSKTLDVSRWDEIKGYLKAFNKGHYYLEVSDDGENFKVIDDCYVALRNRKNQPHELTVVNEKVVNFDYLRLRFNSSEDHPRIDFQLYGMNY
jgi:hypothetical protein